MKPTRLWLHILASLILLTATGAIAAAQDQSVSIGWLGDQAPRVASGVSFGVPWAKGEVSADTVYKLTTSDGRVLPLQSWPLAYWPDGSMKWTGLATVAGSDATGEFTLTTGSASSPAADAPSVSVKEDDDSVTVDTGAVRAVLPKRGRNFLASLSIDGRVVATGGRLVCILQDGPADDVLDIPETSAYYSEVKTVTVEQRGPVRAVVKVDGVHKEADGDREWLPFHLRLYFYAGIAPVRMVHSFVFDGDQNEDFIRGLGVTFDVPFREEIHNRHVRFGGQEDGLFAEPVEPFLGWRGGGGAMYAQQVAGRRIPNLDEMNPGNRNLLEALAVWNDYRLMQPNADGFTIEKRTGAHSAWIDAAAGDRATGAAFVGDVSGGLNVSVKDFWQSYPKSLEIRGAATDVAQLRVWLWSPDAPVMDVRHYDDHAHGLDNNYEDVEMELATAYGVARSHELTLYPSAEAPDNTVLAAEQMDAAMKPLLVAAPQHLHDVKAFGVWSLPDSSTPFKQAVEDRLNDAVDFYQTSVEQFNWYGFWNYGDFMHGYDPTRHKWRYDIGGFAWDNSEQGTDMWLWYMFLRSGRADIFRMAEAMTRHTGEVDSYHIGPLAGLGSRHNVRHWGDGAKEARISMAPFRRFFYYLTTDERTGDVMREMLQADEAIARLDPMRKADPPTEADKNLPARIRGGPDWFALLGNWWTEWERTGDPKWRDRIMASIESIVELPYWFKTGRNLLWGFDPETGRVIVRDPNPGGYNLVTNMGGPEIMMEFCDHLDDPTWNKVWLQYCRLTNANDPELLKRDQETGAEGAGGQYAGGGKIAAYAYYKTGNEAFVSRALSGLNQLTYFDNMRTIDGPDSVIPIQEGPTGLITNDNNNAILHAIEVLEMCADQLPEEAPAARGRGFGRGRGQGRGQGRGRSGGVGPGQGRG